MNSFRRYKKAEMEQIGTNYDDTTIKLFEVIPLLVSNFIPFSSLDRYFAVTRSTKRQMAVVAQY